MSYNFDTKKYGRLLAKAVPRKIETEEENERLLAIIEKLMAKDENKLSAEELALLSLLSGLVEEYEENSVPVGEGTPLTALQLLVEEHGLKQKDLHGVFGSSGITSEVFSGKRSISKTQAKKLGERFHLPADVFI